MHKFTNNNSTNQIISTCEHLLTSQNNEECAEI